VNPLEVLLEDRAVALVCAIARISGLVIVAPLPWTVAPLRVRAALVLILALVASASPFPIDPHLAERPISMALSVISEVGIGACMGISVRFLIAAAEIAGEFIAPQIGLGVSQLFDPHTHVSESALGSALRHMAMLLAVLVGLHRQVIAALLGSFELLPPGAIVNPGRAAGAVLALMAGSVETGLRIALPTVAVLFMVQIALAFIARAAPALQIFSVGFAVTLGVGLLVVLLSLPDTAGLLLAEISHIDTRVQTLLGTLLESPP
jgi:flagellar biosynthetic protein FliR